MRIVRQPRKTRVEDKIDQRPFEPSARQRVARSITATAHGVIAQAWRHHAAA